MQQPPGAPGVSPQPEVLPPGTILLNRYRILSFIGGGGFGSIYEVLDLALGHRRAIKEAFGLDPQAQHQFRLEAEFLLNVQHPNLVRGYAVFEQANKLYLVMEYVDGQTLEDIAIDYIRRTGRALPEEQVIEWMLPICDAVFALHAQPVPIIHRDIKPANIKLSQVHGPVLIDLGLAKLHIEGQNTIRAALAFTPGYAPPEQYRASGATDRRTDIYGLGATLFYLFTGYQPTEAPARLSAQALPMPRTLNTILSPGSEAVVLKAMALDPAERYQDAHAMADDLQRALAALRANTSGGDRGTRSRPGTQPAHSGGWASSGQHAPVGTPALHEAPTPAYVPLAANAPSAQNGAHALAATGAIPVAPVVSAPGPDAGPVCPKCKVVNPPLARFCMRCGTGLSGPGARREGNPSANPATDLRPARGHTGHAPARNPAQARAEAPMRDAHGHHHSRLPGQPFYQPVRGPGARLSPAGVGLMHGTHRAHRAYDADRHPRQEPLSGPIAAVARAVERVIPGAFPAAERLHGRLRALVSTPQELEAWTSILAMLAVACLALSLTALFTRGMLIFVLPALVLGHVSLAQHEAPPPREFRYLALTAVICGYAWVLILLIALLISPR